MYMFREKEKEGKEGGREVCKSSKLKEEGDSRKIEGEGEREREREEERARKREGGREGEGEKERGREEEREN